MRQFADSTGVEWQVFEVRRSSDREGAVTPGREGGWLAFASANERRRLAPFPQDWDSLADARLADLCTTAEIVIPRSEEFARERRRVPRLMRRAASEENLGRRHDDPIPTPPPEASQESGDTSNDVAAIIAQHAKECRSNGTTVIAGMVSLRRKLIELGYDSSSDVSKRARRKFVTAFYFGK